jgi:glyoxylase-like metal-dependent hydrolase (beta-lactamase superfamily II)
MMPSLNRWLRENGTPEEELLDLSEASMPVRRFVVPRDPDSTLQGGERIRFGGFELEVIWTPGHSPGHICFYERRQRLLFAGDHILPTITPNISLHPEQTGNPLLDYITSLRRLKTLDMGRALPAHEHMFDDVVGRIEAIEEHHAHRLNEMIDMFDGQPKTGYEIAARTEWVTGPFSNFNAWTKRAAIGETLAHLEYLVVERRLERSHGEDGVVRFVPR